jgi:hypothetical protein
MEVHQTEFLQAVVLAGVVALGMNLWESAREDAHLHASGTQARRAGTQSTSVKQSHIAVAPRRIEVQP